MNKEHHAFPSIEQFSHVRRNVQWKAQYRGLDENNEPLMDRTAIMPVLSYEGTVKLHGCFHKDTLVTLANGDKEKISNLNTGDCVLSYDIDSKKHIVSKVTGVVSQNLEKKWIKLIFDNDTYLICTTDHKIYTKNRGWVEAEKLTEKDVFLEDISEFLP